MKKPHMYASLGVLAAVILAVLFLPLPHSVLATFEIQARDAEPVYVDVPGKLISIDVKPGQQVEAGQQLASCATCDLELDIAKLTHASNQYRVKLENLRQQRFSDPPRPGPDSPGRRGPQGGRGATPEKRRRSEALALEAPLPARFCRRP